MSMPRWLRGLRRDESEHAQIRYSHHRWTEAVSAGIAALNEKDIREGNSAERDHRLALVDLKANLWLVQKLTASHPLPEGEGCTATEGNRKEAM